MTIKVIKRQLPAFIEREGALVPEAYLDWRFDDKDSGDYLTIDKAVAFANKQGGVLQSLPEAAAIRVESRGSLEGADDYQITRTVPLVFREDFRPGGDWYLAISDEPCRDANVLLARCGEAASAFRKGVWRLPGGDLVVRAMIDAAERDDRVAKLPEDRLPYSSSVVGGVDSEFARGPVAKAFFKDMAPAYGAHLENKGYHNGRLWLLTDNHLEGVGCDEVAIRPVGLGLVNIVFADFNYVGRSRAVAPKKNSP